MVVIIPLMCNGHAIITSVFIPETILDQTRQNGYQTNPFGVYTFIIRCLFFHFGASFW